MQHHDSRHAQGQHVYEIGCSLEDDGVGQFNASSVADCLDARPAIRNRIRRTHHGAHWQSALATYRLEISKAHGSLATGANGGGEEVCRLLRVQGVGVRFRAKAVYYYVIRSKAQKGGSSE